MKVQLGFGNVIKPCLSCLMHCLIEMTTKEQRKNRSLKTNWKDLSKPMSRLVFLFFFLEIKFILQELSLKVSFALSFQK